MKHNSDLRFQRDKLVDRTGKSATPALSHDKLVDGYSSGAVVLS